MKILAAFDAVLDVVDAVIRWFAGAALIAIMLLLFGNSLLRYAFSYSFIGAYAWSQYLMVWLTFIGAYLLVRSNRHINIDILLRFVSPRTGACLTAVTGFVGFATMGYVLILGARLTAVILGTGQIDPTIAVPKGVLYLALPIGAGLMALGFLHLACTSAIRAWHGEFPPKDNIMTPN